MEFLEWVATELRGGPEALTPWQRYGIAVLLVLFAVLFGFLAAPVDIHLEILTFYPVVLLAALLLGPVAGAVTLVLSAAAAAYFFPVTGRTYAIPLFLLFGGLSCLVLRTIRQLIATAFSRQYRTRQRLEESQRVGQIGSWEWDHATDRILWSDESYRVFRIPRSFSPMTGIVLSKFIHPDDRERMLSVFRDDLQPGSSFEATFRLAEPVDHPAMIEIRGRVEHDADGRPVRSLGTVRDVTELRALQEQLREKVRTTETDFQGLATAAGVGIFVTDERGRCTYANPQFELMAGVPAGGALGDGWSKSAQPGNMDQVRRLWLATVKKEVLNPQITCSWTVNGTLRWYTMRSAALPGPDPRRNRFLATFEDITELQNSLDQVRDLAQRLEQVREEERHAIALVLHEGIAQELFAAQLALKFLLGESKGRNGVKRAYDELSVALQKCMASTRQVANDLLPAGLGKMRLAAALANHAQQFEQYSGLKIRIDEASDFPELDEATQLIYFRAAQEALRNVARHANAHSVDLALSVQNGQVTMQVRDDGIGIDDSALTKAGSLGLLGIRERFESIGGSVGVRRNQDRGTTVCASTPLATRH